MGLRQAIDEGAGDIGEATAAEFPEEPADVREAVPDDPDDTDAVPDDLSEASLEGLLEETPLARFL